MKGIAIGVTGGIACGKSEVGAILEGQGVPVLDTDRVGHDLMKRGNDAYTEIINCFGRTIMGAAGEIDRGLLGKIVFSDGTKREQLNTILHPRIKAQWKKWLSHTLESQRAAAVMVPLLFEVGETECWDAILCVSAPERLIIERLQKKGLPSGDIRARLAAQLPLSEKEKRADYVIENNGSLEDLKERTIETLHAILKKGAPRS